MVLVALEPNPIVQELVKVYYDQEWWHRTKMEDRAEAYKYHDRLLNQGNIIVYREDNILLGYVEFWRLSFEQFGRIICKEHFSAYHEDVLKGYIAYVANTWIHPEYRYTEVYKVLKMNFISANFSCKYFVGEALRKKTQPVKVFNREHILKQGVEMGKDKTTKETEQKSSQSSTVQATPEEEARNKMLLEQEQTLSPQSTGLQNALFDLSTALARGGSLPGFFSPLSEGLTQETIGLAADEAVQDVLPRFQDLGILESGSAQTGAIKAATGERVAGEKFNLALLSDLLGAAFTGSQVPLQASAQSSDLLSRTLAGLRGTSIAGTQFGSTTQEGMNPFFKSFQTSLGKTLGSPTFIPGFGG